MIGRHGLPAAKFPLWDDYYARVVGELGFVLFDNGFALHVLFEVLPISFAVPHFQLFVLMLDIARELCAQPATFALLRGR